MFAGGLAVASLQSPGPSCRLQHKHRSPKANCLLSPWIRISPGSQNHLHTFDWDWYRQEANDTVVLDIIPFQMPSLGPFHRSEDSLFIPKQMTWYQTNPL